MLEVMDQQICPSCNFPISGSFVFCPNCGKKIKEPPVSTTIAKQIGIYALSVLLPPLGLWPGIKYLLQKDQKSKIIGIVAIVLTIFSTIISIWVAINFFNQINKIIGSQNLGF